MLSADARQLVGRPGKISLDICVNTIVSRHTYIYIDLGESDSLAPGFDFTPGSTPKWSMDVPMSNTTPGQAAFSNISMLRRSLKIADYMKNSFLTFGRKLSCRQISGTLGLCVNSIVSLFPSHTPCSIFLYYSLCKNPPIPGILIRVVFSTTYSRRETNGGAGSRRVPNSTSVFFPPCTFRELQSLSRHLTITIIERRPSLDLSICCGVTMAMLSSTV